MHRTKPKQAGEKLTLTVETLRKLSETLSDDQLKQIQGGGGKTRSTNNTVIGC